MEKIGHRQSLSRSAMKAMGLFGSLQVLTILCSVVRVKCVALWIGATGLGLFTIYNAAITLISTITQLNLRSSSVREIAAASPDRRDLISAVTRRWGWLLGVAGAVVMTATAPVFSIRTFGDYGYTLPFALLAAGVLLNSACAGEQSVMQGRGELRHLASSTLWASVAGLLACLPLVYFLGDTGIIPSIIAYSAAGYAAAHLYRSRLAPVRTTSGDLWRTGGPMLRLGAFMTVAAAFTELLNYILITYINTRGGTSEVGIFQAGYTMVNRYVGMVFAALGTEFYPRLAAASESPMRQQTFVSHEVLVLLLTMLPLILIFMPFVSIAVTILYSSEFTGAVPYVILALPGMVARVCVWCWSFVILARGDGRTYIITEALCDTITLAAAIAGYALCGMSGLGASFSVSTILSLSVIGPVYFRVYRLRMARPVVRLFAGSLLLSIAGAVTAYLWTPWAILPVGLIAALPCLKALRKLLNS